MKRKIEIIKRDDKQNIVVDEHGNCRTYNKEITLEDALGIIEKSFKIERKRFGFEVYINDESIFFRFGNITAKKKDSAASFVKKNWNKD